MISAVIFLLFFLSGLYVYKKFTDFYKWQNKYTSDLGKELSDLTVEERNILEKIKTRCFLNIFIVMAAFVIVAVIIGGTYYGWLWK